MANGAGAVLEQFAGAVGPGEGQGEQAHELGEAVGVREVGVFEVEAPGFQSGEQGFHLPAIGIGPQGLGLWRASTT